MILRSFDASDASTLRNLAYPSLSIEQMQSLIEEWNQKQFKGHYFEMFAILSGEAIVGTISLYQHTTEAVSIGPEIFIPHRRQGFAKQAMQLACDFAKKKGYKIVSQQIRTDNHASIALHTSLGFETDGTQFTNAKGNQVALYLKSLL